MTQGHQNAHQPGPALVLTTLGGAALSFTDERGSSAQVLGAGKPLALFIYLSSSPGRTASREHLTGLLWADLDPKAARHTLAQTVFALRQRLGDDAVSSENGDVVLQVSVRSDRDAFLAAVDAMDLEEAVGLYAGDFLPEFAVPGAAEFEHWADLERDRLRMTFVRTGYDAGWPRVVRVRRNHWRDACETYIRAAKRLGDCCWSVWYRATIRWRQRSKHTPSRTY